MIQHVGEEAFDKLLSGKVGLRVALYEAQTFKCPLCQRRSNASYNFPNYTQPVCLTCFNALQSKFAAILVLQVTGGK